MFAAVRERIRRRFGRRADPPQDEVALAELEATSSAIDPQVRSEASFAAAANALGLGDRLGKSAAWIALGGAVALSAWAAFGRAQPPAAAAGPTVEVSSTGASGYAAMYLHAWLDAGKDDAKYLLALQPDAKTPTRPAHSFVVTTLVPVVAQRVDGGVWSVTLQGLISHVSGGTYTPPELHCFTVSVVQSPAPTAAAYRAIGEPAEVACPPVAAAPDTDYTSSVGTGPVADTVTAFLSSYLGGQGGSVTRYLSPDATVIAPSPSPYAAVKVDSIQIAGTPKPPDGLATTVPGDDTHVRVLVHITATTAGGVTTTLDYPLTLNTRGGRWEVAALDAAPVIDSKAPVPPPSPSVSASSSSAAAPAAPPT